MDQVSPYTSILRRRQVEARVGLRRSAIYAAIAAGSFPKPIAIGVRAVGWLSADIDAWIDARIRDSRS
jgi:prophage regulatory protein